MASNTKTQYPPKLSLSANSSKSAYFIFTFGSFTSYRFVWKRDSSLCSTMMRNASSSSTRSTNSHHETKATARTIAGSVAIYWITVSLIPIYNKYFFKKQLYPFPIATAGIQLAGVALLLGVVNSLECALLTRTTRTSAGDGSTSSLIVQVQQQSTSTTTPQAASPSWILGPHLLYKLSWCFPIGVLFGLKYGVTNWGLDLLPAPTHLLLQSTDLVWTVLTAWLINQERIRPLESLCLVGCILGSFVLGWSHVLSMEHEQEENEHHSSSPSVDLKSFLLHKNKTRAAHSHMDDPLYAASSQHNQHTLDSADMLQQDDDDDEDTAPPWLAIGVNLLSPMLLGLCISTLRLATVELMRPDNCVQGKVTAVELTCLKLILSSAVATALAIWLVLDALDQCRRRGIVWSSQDYSSMDHGRHFCHGHDAISIGSTQSTGSGSDFVQCRCLLLFQLSTVR